MGIILAKQTFVKRPPQCYAIQYDGTNHAEVLEFCPGAVYDEALNKLSLNMIGVDPTSWIVENSTGQFSIMIDEHFVVEYEPGKGAVVVPICRYEPRQMPMVEAVMWNGENFVEVQVVCPQAVQRSSVVSIPALGDAYLGEVVLRDLGTGKFSKMEVSLFNVFYGVQTI